MHTQQEKITASPILFTAEMVRAILDGRKTQTRRIVKNLPAPVAKIWHDGAEWIIENEQRKTWNGKFTCPYGQPGDHLWVRETHMQWVFRDGEKGEIAYLDDPHIEALKRDMEALKKQKNVGNWRIIPSIHMPRAASRILLEITDIRAQRLHDITEADAVAEGCASGGDLATAPTVQYSNLWEKINGPHSWEQNPWVWAITFKKIG